MTVQLCLDRAAALKKSGRKDEAKALMDTFRRTPAAVQAVLPGRSTVDVLLLDRNLSRR